MKLRTPEKELHMATACTSACIGKRVLYSTHVFGQNASTPSV